ncbi:MAG: hypothetical protein V8Q75_03880 [Bacilli bacterium]
MTDEYVIVNLLGSMVGLDAILATRFNDDQKFLYTALENRGVDLETIKNILNQMNYNYRMNDVLNQSMLADIEKATIDAFSKSNPTLAEIENFTSQLVTNAEYMESQKDYPGLNQVDSYFKVVSGNLKDNVNINDNNYHKAV